MYLVLHADTSSEWNTNVNSVVIEITRKALKNWLDKARLFKKLKAEDEGLISLEYMTAAITDVAWLRGEEVEGRISVKKPEMNENADETANDQTIVATEIDRFAVDNYDLEFTAYIDNSNVKVTAECISVKRTRRLYKALSASKKQLGLMLNEEDDLVKQIVEARLRGEL